MPFKDRFYEKIISHSKVYGPNFESILRNQKTIENAINTLGENTIFSLSCLIGAELGKATRKKVFMATEGEFRSEKTYIETLKDSFKEHMAKYGINVAYGLDDESLYIEFNKCIFTKGGINKRLCSYSINFLEEYFNATAEKIMSIEKGNYCCLFRLKLKA